MVNFQGSILDSLLANYVKAHSHIIYIFLRFPKTTLFLCLNWKERRIHIYWTCLSFRITLCSQQTVCGINECKFFTPNVREVLEVIFCTNAILEKSFHNIIVKMSKLARLHGVRKKRSLRQTWSIRHKSNIKCTNYSLNKVD